MVCPNCNKLTCARRIKDKYICLKCRNEIDAENISTLWHDGKSKILEHVTKIDEHITKAKEHISYPEISKTGGLK